MFDIVSLKKEIYIILMAMLPVVELRGAIPMGRALGFSPEKSLVLGLIGNILIVPILLKLLLPTMDIFEKTEIFNKTIGKIKRRTLRKTKDRIKKYSLFGIFLFVAIPIPTTGAWTACLAASLLKLDYKKSLVAISTGVLVAGIIVYLLVKNII